MVVGAPQVRAASHLLVDVETGKVLEADNATHPWYPASVTKLMTLYVTLKAVKEGRISFDTLFTVTSNAVAQEPAKMGFPLGTQVTVDNAIKMMMVKSANDMAVLLAEGVSGSIEKFADDMNDAAQHLGMTQTSYVNPNGLPAEGQITSARDLAILARALIREFPEYSFYWHIPAIKFGRRVTHNYNPLIERYPGADGMKTGFICSSGFNLVATATRNNKQLIAVVLGASSSTARALQAAQMLEKGFSGDQLAWLTPALGTVEELKPMQASPPDLHDEICGKHHKKGKGRSETEEVESSDNPSDPNAQSFMLSSLQGPNASLLLSQPVQMAPPIVVYAGPAKGGTSATQFTSNSKQNLEAAKRAAKSGQAASEALASGKQTVASFGSAPVPSELSPAGTPIADSIPLPRPRPKIAKLKSATR
jgi:D-alanyl-D-alanine carboxypeptidase